MKMRDFIRQNRTEIDTAINRVKYRYDGNSGRGIIPYPLPSYSDKERRRWILDDEFLNGWARQAGVPV